MNSHRSTKVAAAALCAVVAACGHTPAVPGAAQLGSGSNDKYGASASPRNGDSTATLPEQRGQYSSLNVYKSDAALHVLQRNADRTFTGALPPMLPAIVVLRITVEPNGKLHRATVLRSRDDMASQIAVASMQRTAYLPMPRNLGVEPGGQLTYLETFLFNEDYRFQLRTMAPVQ